MENHDLWIFKHVSELQSVSKAAEKLGYVQSNVSQRLKSLEDELGVRLFIRNSRGVTLTEEGKVLLEYTNQILLLLDEAKSLINPKKWKDSLTIGAPQTISAVRIPQLLSSFLRENKNIDVKVRTQSKKQHVHTLIVNSDINCIYRNKLLDFSKEGNFQDPAIMEFDSLESILQAVNDGLGISIIPAIFYREYKIGCK